MSIVSDLPVELIQEYLLYLNSNDIFKTVDVFKLPTKLLQSQYFWRLKFKVDQVQPIQHSENYEKYRQKFQSTEQAFYFYFYKLRRMWLTKSWNDALKSILGKNQGSACVVAVHERIIVCRNFDSGNMSFKFEILNTASRKVICKYQSRHCFSVAVKVHFPLIVYACFDCNEMFLYNIEDQKWIWKSRFSRTLDPSDVFCTNSNMIATLTSDATLVSLIQMSSGIIKSILVHNAKVKRASFCNNYLLTITSTNELHVWDVNSKVLKYSMIMPTLSNVKFVANDNKAYAILLSDKKYSVLHLDSGKMHKLELKLWIINNYPMNIALRNSQFIFFDFNNNLQVMDFIKNEYLVTKAYKIPLKAVTVNRNFIVLATFYDIRILDAENLNELRTFSLETAVNWKNSKVTIFKALESKLVIQYTQLGFQRDDYQFILDFDVPL